MDSEFILRPPLLTADLPGIGGRIKTLPEDFEVEEIPAYPPSGSGEFLYLWVEKRDMGAEYFVRQVAARLGISSGDVGTAGLKDRRAVTRQMVSIPISTELQLSRLDGDGIRVLNVSRHTNKLRPGHLHGNRFRILLREIELATASERAARTVSRINVHGLPNYYGPQRFGRAGETLALGMQLLGAWMPESPHPQPLSPKGRGEPKRRLTPFLKKLAISAAQSGLFNHYLGQRWCDGLLHRVLPGDVMAKVPFGGLFVAEDPATEQARFDHREIVPAGPIFGRKTFPANDEAAAREQAVLAAFGFSAASFGSFGKLAQGTRRHNLVFVDDLTLQTEAEGLRVSFTLPAGSYATVLLGEIMKNDLLDDGEAVE